MRFRLKNKSYVLNTKIKLVGKNGANLSIITSDINNPTSNYNLTANTITFCLSPLPAVIGDPKVIVNENTTAALDFENGLIDKIPTTIWTKEGTADITSVNKLFGQNSFETKALGDSLYTNSNIITGGSTPFTIEFYALISGRYGFSNQYVGYPLLFKNNDGSGVDNGFGLEQTKGNKVRFIRLSPSNTFEVESYGYHNIQLNEIYKYTITYDGSALRWFINDKLDSVTGILNGFKTSNSRPFTFFERYASDNIRIGAKGIIDNINIHDGIVTKVRDPDPYEEFLVVDLAFDGENNSTKIVDNGTAKLTFSVVGDNVKISTEQKFDGYSSLKNSRNGYLISNTQPITSSDISTISFEFYIENINNNNVYYDTYDGSYNNTFQLLNYNGKFVLWYSNITVQITTLQNQSKNKITFIYNSRNVKVYVNGYLKLNTTLDVDLNFGSKFALFGQGVYPNPNYYSDGYFKNFKIYKGIAIPPKQKITFLINVNISSSSVNSNLSWNTSNATVNTDYFTGYLLNTSGNSAFTFYGSDFILRYKFKGYGNLLREWNTNLRYMLSINSSGVISFNFYETGPTQRTITTNSQTLSSDINELELTRSNGYFFIKLNGIPYTVTQTGAPYSGNIYGPTTEGVRLGDAGVTTYSIDIYTEKSEDLDKIQLDFDNNVVDKYGNSTWTNNGVTFDNINSIKGSAGYFNGSSNLQLNNNSLLNFGNKNFNIEFDGNKLNNNQTYSSWLTPNGASYPSQWCELSSWNSNLQRFQNLAASAPELTGAVLNLNTWYKWQLTRNNGTVILKANDVVTGISNYTPSMNVNFNNGTGTNLIGVSSNAMNCYVDNFKSEKDYKGEIIIDKPAVHLPLETNSTNIGFTPLTINSVGSPTYTTIDGKKCIKFESGKYLTINSNNIFNLGTNSDFYIEFDFYPLSDKYHHIFSSGNSTGILSSIAFGDSGSSNKIVYAYAAGTFIIGSGTTQWLQYQWNNIKLYRKDNKISLELNGNIFEQNVSSTFNFANTYSTIGQPEFNSGSYSDGYMSNFKMFVGTSEIPETYNDKAVLDLDFKPTRKSYLFKDNNNKCIVHPVNIAQRNYQNSQYCCSFNGIDQCLQLGKNDLLNFGYDDFIIEIKFKPVSTTNWNILISNGNITSGDAAYCYLGVSPNNHGTPNQMYANINSSAMLIIHPQQIDANSINTVIFYKEGNTYTLVVNGQAVSNTVTNIPNFDLNNNNNTIIGRTNHNSGSNNHWFTGEMYSVKIFRNTSNF